LAFLRVRRGARSAHIDEALQKVKPEWRAETDGNRRQRTFVSGAALLRSFRKSSLIACFIAQVVC